MFYAGIGSRRAPSSILKTIEYYAAQLASGGLVLRSGGADGCDSAFETGCDSVSGEKEIWLPYSPYNGRVSKYTPNENHIQLARSIHPIGDRLSGTPMKLHARNTGQILGSDLKTPVRFVLCWTPDGCSHFSTYSRDTGGTGTAIVLASKNGIPVINMESSFWETELNTILENL